MIIYIYIYNHKIDFLLVKKESTINKIINRLYNYNRLQKRNMKKAKYEKSE